MRECEGEGARVRQRWRNLAPSPSHSRDLQPRIRFQTRLEFLCENLAFVFLNKQARLGIASGPNGTPSKTSLFNFYKVFSHDLQCQFYQA